MMTHGPCTFELPAGWEDRTDTVLLGPSDGSHRPSIVISHTGRTKAISPQDYAREQEPSLRATLGGDRFEMMDRTAVTVDGHKAWAVSFKASLGNPPVRKSQMQIYLVRGLLVTTLTFTDEVDRFPKTRQQFLAFVAKLKLN